MTIKKITSFRFPVGEKELSQDAYYKALSEAKSGFYPFGINGIWHGGIHIDQSVLKEIDNDDRMRCMANGEVIAYRINDVYPKAVYQEIKVPCKGQRVAYFSSGFTLVRHYLQMPKIAGSTDTPPAITLYSLYMHQLDWYGYQQRMQNSETEILSPKFWSVTSGRVSPDTTEIIKGSVIRINGSGTEIVGLLLKDSKIRLGERKGTNWYKIVSISEGSVVTSQGVTSELGDIQGYVFSGDVTPVPTDKSANATIDYQVVKEDNNAIGKAEVKVKGITVYASANEKQKLAYLPNTATFLFNGQENGYAKIRQISGCYVPVALNNPNGDQDSPHQGYVKISSLSSLTFKPERLDEIVVLKTPIPISKGEFIGYLGHNVSQKERFDESEEEPLATTRRVSDNKLPKLAHIELFTCDDLPTFINQTRALANNLPEYEKTVISIEKDARLTHETEPDGSLNTGLGINFIGDVNNYYVKIKPEYTLDLPTLYFNPTRVFPFLFNTTVGGIFDSINVDTEDTNDKPKKYTLTQADKSWLIDHYQSTYPELTINDIPDEVDLVSDVTRILSRDNSDNTFTISFILENKHYWIKSVDVVHLQGESGQLNTKIDYWDNFPLSLGNLPEATEKDTVYFPRTLSIDSLSHDYSTIAIDENNAIWVFVTAGNKQGSPIKGWVNTATDAQEHIKRETPWHWSGFNTIEDKASVGEVSKKLAAILDVGDCTETMLALLRIFKQSSINILPPEQFPEGTKNDIEILSLLLQNKLRYPFSIEQYKDALRTSWTAEQIGHLLLKYESEWYADDALSKWNEIDNLFEDEKQQKKKALEEDLHKAGIIKPHERNYALEKLEESHEIVKSNWQIEKEQRIKPSLWWKKVAELQVQEAQTTNDNQTNSTNTPQLTNLSTDGKAWFIHPVAMIEYFTVLNIVTYHIYHDGNIEKHIPQRITSGFEKKYKYIYHDKDDNEHEVCICEWHTIKKKLLDDNPTGRYTYPNHGTVQESKTVVNDGYIESRATYTNGDIHEWIKTESGVSIYQRLTMTNGDIAEYGYHSDKLGNVWKLYRQQEEEAQLIRIPDSVNYVNDDVIIKYELKETFRKYTNPDVMAGFIGALAEIKENIIVTGSAYEQGSCFPSSLHINGQAIDTKYIKNVNNLSNWDKDKAFAEALMKFHFRRFRIGPLMYAFFNGIDERKDGGTLHNTHLHTENFDFESINKIP
ncbi:hypothetical protein A9G11_05610 [Gilliamella sp. wkB108]|uniref:hypothetical protein n=1 Tax=Gilliamella sp. wkB108 TaxID=3120256 RepID=UPI00080E727F|nr:hypothetical protein [Gilliamella apicola]OCG23686.1 hypothetical protein A9G11_05610 [Gilliamella apicola]